MKGMTMSDQNFEPSPPAPAAATVAKRPVYKKKRFAIPAGVVLFGIILGSCSSGATPSAEDGQVSTSATAEATETVSEPPAPEPTAAAPAETTAAPVETEAAAPVVGTPFSVDMGSGDVARITIVSAEWTDTVGTPDLSIPAENGAYLLLDVLWETESGTTSANPFYFSAKDTEGRSADISIFVDGPLAAGDVLPGDKRRGFVAFDITQGPTTVMIFTPLMQEAARLEIAG